MLGDIAQMLGQQGAVPTCVTGRRRRVQRRNDPPPMLGLVMPWLATARRIRHPGQAVPGKPFAQKAADVVALYLQPPENAVVLSVDEKPHIQALERAQGWLKLPNSKALTGFNHEYKRHGTTTLFAALEITTGLVKAGHYRRRRRVEFLHFMNRIVAQHPGWEMHVILDNLNTHKPKHDRWLARHKNVHFHFTPTHASWLNQVEVWFSILSRHALAGASFTSPPGTRADRRLHFRLQSGRSPLRVDQASRLLEASAIVIR